MVSADKVTRWKAMSVAFSGNVIRRRVAVNSSAGNIIRRGIAVSIFSDKVTRWETMSVASADNVIMWEVVVGGFADDAPAKCVVGSGAFGGVAEGYCGGGVAFGDMIADGSWWKLQR